MVPPCAAMTWNYRISERHDWWWRYRCQILLLMRSRKLVRATQQTDATESRHVPYVICLKNKQVMQEAKHIVRIKELKHSSSVCTHILLLKFSCGNALKKRKSLKFHKSHDVTLPNIKYPHTISLYVRPVWCYMKHKGRMCCPLQSFLSIRASLCPCCSGTHLRSRTVINQHASESTVIKRVKSSTSEEVCAEKSLHATYRVETLMNRGGSQWRNVFGLQCCYNVRVDGVRFFTVVWMMLR